MATKKKAAKKAAKKVAKKPVAKKAVKKAAKKKVAKKKPARKPNAAFMKALTPSAALGAVVGTKALPRTEAVKNWLCKPCPTHIHQWPAPGGDGTNPPMLLFAAANSQHLNARDVCQWNSSPVNLPYQSHCTGFECTIPVQQVADGYEY